MQHARDILARIERAARRSGRDPAQIRLVAATKGVAADKVQAALSAGVRVVGENRFQEAVGKMAAIGPRADLEWHFLGQVQRRKAKSIVGIFQLIHSLDSVELAQELNRRAEAVGIEQAVLVELNIGGEASKAGFSPEEVRPALRELDRMTHLSVRGLMTIPPPTTDTEQARPYFREVRERAQSYDEMGLTRVRMDELSMGMSNDFEVAVEEGATFVRVGTAIFGARDV
ncbi:MAG: YggS family pyridoxal phosphate-dependent enzyme [Nitrospirae bacterium]|nr:YggS family pyridoxal phosphate-dependent enzyme [Nitrospirota bacterium]